MAPMTTINRTDLAGGPVQRRRIRSTPVSTVDSWCFAGESETTWRSAATTSAMPEARYLTHEYRPRHQQNHSPSGSAIVSAARGAGLARLILPQLAGGRHRDIRRGAYGLG